MYMWYSIFKDNDEDIEKQKLGRGIRQVTMVEWTAILNKEAKVGLIEKMTSEHKFWRERN